jgi:hypothetical protein
MPFDTEPLPSSSPHYHLPSLAENNFHRIMLPSATSSSVAAQHSEEEDRHSGD